MTLDDEKFVHLVECVTSLNNAWGILVALQNTEVPPIVRAAAYRMALVEYAKPYNSSRGIQKWSHKLFPPDFSQADHELHSRIVTLRDQVLAHSDLSVKEARLHLKKIHGEAVPLIVYSLNRSFPGIEDVLGLIERSLDKLYVIQHEWEQRLVPPA